MLKLTKEFQDFASISEDSFSNIRFLKDVRQRSYLDLEGCPNPKCKNFVRPCCKPTDIVDEKYLWIPEEAYKFAHEFRLKY